MAQKIFQDIFLKGSTEEESKMELDWDIDIFIDIFNELDNYLLLD